MFEINSHIIILSRFQFKVYPQETRIQNLIRKTTTLETENKQIQGIIFLDEEAIAGIQHLKACIHYAIKSFENRTNIANSVGTEIMLFISGQRQIKKAINLAGITKNTKKVIVIELLTNKNLKKKKSRKIAVTVDIKEMLLAQNLQILKFQKNIDTLPLQHNSKAIRNLQITEKEISIFNSAKSPLSRYEIIERLAIEKSSLLSLEQ
ncbi:MAG: KEOPS complex subunit Cgi121 [Asgard group archaeon]|nr:KEOPS complex subunit Cgi121 [Asgard group archaeon]